MGYGNFDGEHGVKSYIRMLAKNLASEYILHALSSFKSKRKSSIFVDGMTIHNFPLRYSFISILGQIFSLRKLVKDNNVDILED